MDNAVATPWRKDAGVIGLVALGHAISHYSQLLLAPLFPWLKDAFGVGYAELGFLMTIFFVVSCVAQAVSGFWVDRYGPRRVLFAGLTLIGIAALGFAASTSYTMLALFSVLAGTGNGVFHPVDYTLLNRRVSKKRLGHAYSAHGISGSLGWALAPAMVVPLTMAFSWRIAVLCAAALVFSVLAVLVWRREDLKLATIPAPSASAVGEEGTFAFLRIPAIWMCFLFFLLSAGALGIMQAFAPEAARQLHGVPVQMAALCLTVYMLAAACGMVLGGFLAGTSIRSEPLLAVAFGMAALVALWLGYGTLMAAWVPVLFGVMGFAIGVAGPSRDLIVKSATPANASGRVYGVVYAGLDIGQALAPLVIGRLMDLHRYSSVLLALALLQGSLIITAFSVHRVRRSPVRPLAA